MSTPRTLIEVLQSTSENLFPDRLGEAKVLIGSADCNGDTPLHVLIWRGDVDGALLLINSGANVNAVGDMGETPLHAAISQNQPDIIKVLLSAGARLDVVSAFGQTPIDKAAAEGIELEMYK